MSSDTVSFTKSATTADSRAMPISSSLPAKLLHGLLILACPVYAWEPTWESLDSRPLPGWFDEAKFGIFVHWGVFSVPSFGSEWFWYYWQSQKDPRYVEFVKATEAPGFTYQEYAHRFHASLYNPTLWAKLFADSGAQYVVMTAKHHEGFCNWDSREAVPETWNWNSMDIGPHRDILGDLASAVKKQSSPMTQRKLHWGIYHSMFEWFNPNWLADSASGFKSRNYRNGKTIPELYDLVKKYEPELLWSDGAGAPDSYWNATEFLAWYATNSSVAKTAVWNDRWSIEASCKHGAYLTCSDRFQPGKLQKKKWENCFTIDSGSWGYNRNATIESYLSIKSLIDVLVETVAFGGNMLLNVGPSHEGTIDAIFADRLLGIGSWLEVNGEAIYSTAPWTVSQNETSSSVYYTAKPDSDTVYAIATKWPKGNLLELRAPRTTPSTKVHMLGLKDGLGRLQWNAAERGSGGLTIKVPSLTPESIPCQHAWVFAMTGIANIRDSKTMTS